MFHQIDLITKEKGKRLFNINYPVLYLVIAWVYILNKKKGME